MVRIYHSQVLSSVAVSTVRTAPGAYETSITIDGHTAEPRRHSRAACEVEHDRACDYVRGSLESRSTLGAYWARACAEVAL